MHDVNDDTRMMTEIQSQDWNWCTVMKNVVTCILVYVCIVKYHVVYKHWYDVDNDDVCLTCKKYLWCARMIDRGLY